MAVGRMISHPVWVLENEPDTCPDAVKELCGTKNPIVVAIIIVSNISIDILLLNKKVNKAVCREMLCIFACNVCLFACSYS